MSEDNSGAGRTIVPSTIRKLDDDGLMTSILAKARTLNEIITNAHNAARPHQIDLGTALIEAKDRYGRHALWLGWVPKNLPFH